MPAIEGVSVSPLKTIADGRGKVMHMLNVNHPNFAGFGEIYFSVVNPGVVKGWKTHHRTVQNMVVPHGRVTFLLRDLRPDSPTRGQTVKVTLSDGNPDQYRLLTVPPGVTYAWRNESESPSYVANLQSAPHDPTEGTTAPLEDNPPDWDNTPEE